MTAPQLASICPECGDAYLPPATCCDLEPERCASCGEPVGTKGHQQRDALDGYLLDVWRCPSCCANAGSGCEERACRIEGAS